MIENGCSNLELAKSWLFVYDDSNQQRTNCGNRNHPGTSFHWNEELRILPIKKIYLFKVLFIIFMEFIWLSTKLSLGSALYAHMKHFRNRIAQYEDETGYVDTYGALMTRCVRAAMKLRELGIGEDDIVSTCSHNHRNSCVPFVASTFIGALPATFDPALSQIDTISLLRLMEPKIIFVSQEALKDFETCIEKAHVKPAHIVVFGDSKGKYLNFDDFLKPQIKEKQFKVYETNDPKKTAVIMFSSGTTGLPKGICLNHYSLLKQSGSFRKDSLEVKANADTVILVYSTLYWISAVTTLIGGTLKGEAKVLCRSFDAKRFWEIVEKYKVTIAFLPPYHLSAVLAERPIGEVDVSNLKELLTGSCPVTAQLMTETIAAFPETSVRNGYGLTELSGAVSLFTRPEDENLQKKKLTSCGRIHSYLQWKVTMTFIPPYYFNDLLLERPKNEEVDVSSLKAFTTGGNPVAAQQMLEIMAAFPGAIVVNIYGQTEVAGVISSITDIQDYHFQKKKLTTVGKVCSQHQWKIVDLESEQPVTGPNQKGEIRIKTDLHMNGYYKMDSSDAWDSEGYLKTGDVGYYDEDNCLFIEDRVKEMFKYRGWHILPAIVEEVLMSHSAVKEAAVIGIPHPDDGERPMGLVVLKKGYENVTSEDIRKFADERLSDAQKLRAGVKIIDELIRTATEKVKRKALREMILNKKI